MSGFKEAGSWRKLRVLKLIFSGGFAGLDRPSADKRRRARSLSNPSPWSQINTINTAASIDGVT